MEYHTMGRLAMGKRALGFSSGFAVKVGNDEPGPQRIKAWSPGEGAEMACGIVSGGGPGGDAGNGVVGVSVSAVSGSLAGV